MPAVLLHANGMRRADLVPEELRMQRMRPTSTQRMEPTPEHRDLATKIARALFTTGDRRLANRLALEVDGRESGFGWSEGPAADRIAHVLAGEGRKS